MTDREALIEEADALYDAIGTRIFRQEFREWYISKFEQAHTPTDDEREARDALGEDIQAYLVMDGVYLDHAVTRSLAQCLLADDEWIIRRTVQGEPSCRHEAYEIDSAGNSTRCADCGATEGLAAQDEPSEDEREALISLSVQWTGDHAYLADAILAAGFRRSEVPEPSACLIEHPVTGSRCSLPAEPRHAHVCDLPAEPQGEPSDAQVTAALVAWEGQPTRIDAMRAALRAASLVG